MLHHVSIGICNNGNKVTHIVLSVPSPLSVKHVGPDPPLVLGFVVRRIALCFLGFIPIVCQSLGLDSFV